MQSALPRRFDDCFAEERNSREFYAIGENGDIIFDDLIDNPAHEEALAELSSRLEEWRGAIGDTDYQPYSDPR